MKLECENKTMIPAVICIDGFERSEMKILASKRSHVPVDQEPTQQIRKKRSLTIL